MTEPLRRGRLVRGVLAAAMAVCISASVAGTASAAAPECAGRGVPTSKISIQLWTFAEYIGFGTDAATIERTRTVFQRLSDMGYRNVEPFTLSGLSAEDYRALLDEYGLKASARHVDVGTPESPADIDQILADNKTLGIKFFGSGSTPIFPPIYTTEAEWVAYAEYLNELGARGAPGRPDADGAQPRHRVRDVLRRPDGVRHPDGEHRSEERRLPARPVLGGQRRRHREPARGDRALRQPDQAVPRQGHGGRARSRAGSRSSARGSSTSRRSSPRPAAARSTTSSSTTRASATPRSTRSRRPRRASTTSTA